MLGPKRYRRQTMTKKELMAAIEAAGLEGFSLANTKVELEEAVKTHYRLGDDMWAKQPNHQARYENRVNRAHSVTGA
jgi:hypothetical protein